MRIYSIILLFAASLVLAGCKSNKTAETKDPTSEIVVPPMEFFQNLVDNCDFIDYIFDDYSFSVSVKQKSNVKGNISYMSSNPVENFGCAGAIGSAYYQAKGNHIAELRIHYDYEKDCGYFLMRDKSKRPKYAFQMSPNGKTFFRQIYQTATQGTAPGNPVDKSN